MSRVGGIFPSLKVKALNGEVYLQKSFLLISDRWGKVNLQLLLFSTHSMLFEEHSFLVCNKPIRHLCSL